MNVHVVKKNETIDEIAIMYGVSVDRIIFDNQLFHPDKLLIGQALLILKPKIIYVVKSQDTITKISNEFQIQPINLVRNNPFLLNQTYLIEGQSLVIEYDGEKEGSYYINGYAYPFIQPYILEETLLFLSELAVFSYGFTVEGELVEIEDEHMIEAAKNFGVAPFLVLTPLDDTGAFNNYLVHVLVSDLNIQNQIIDKLIEVMKTKGYEGIDVDFEYINKEDKEGYLSFLENLTLRMHEAGFLVSVAVAPKESDEHAGLLYEGLDYEAIGKIVDFVLVMTYEWGYTYGPPMAVAPINKVKQVLDYTVTRIPSDKVLMGIPNYGYDWPLPYVKGVTKAKTIGNVEAIDIGVLHNVIIKFDEIAMSPYFEYELDGIEHVVWFEDPRSISVKLDVMKSYGLKGAAYWSIMKYFRSNWMLLNNVTDIV